jgi:signal transduction histidine kinase
LAANLGFLEYLSDGVLILDDRQVIQGINPALENLLGLKAGEMVGQTCPALFGCQHSPQEIDSCQALCSLLTAEALNHTGELHKHLVVKNGQKLEVSARYVPLAAPDFGLGPAGKFSLLILKDLTVEKQRERLQVEFVATASHQLRTPLASIKTAAGLLLDHTTEDFNPLLRRLLQNIQVSNLRMERIVNDLIELTNLQTGRISLNSRPVAISRLVENASQLSRDWLAARQQHLKLDLPPEAGELYVQADYNRICQVLGHLLGNASKFSPSGSTIEIKVRPEAKQTIVFSVLDNGVGIAPDEQPFIFEKFYQVQSVENSTAVGGGLGLPLARAIVELNGGKLWFESQLGRGSVFSFSLPQAVPVVLANKIKLDG